MTLKEKSPADRSHQPQRLATKETFVARVVEVYDGDTVRVELISCRRDLHQFEIIRLAGVDAPEHRGPDKNAANASTLALDVCCGGSVVVVQPTKIWRDPYHRIIARLTREQVDVGAWMIEHGYAVRRRS